MQTLADSTWCNDSHACKRLKSKPSNNSTVEKWECCFKSGIYCMWKRWMILGTTFHIMNVITLHFNLKQEKKTHEDLVQFSRPPRWLGQRTFLLQGQHQPQGSPQASHLHSGTAWSWQGYRPSLAPSADAQTHPFLHSEPGEKVMYHLIADNSFNTPSIN